ncbi:glucose-6-phosphate isomerase family protein [Pseudonocardia nematodicida]|uniref:glucose-6-phosphate isomerase n=1 Tax=Pseudonocardia nematodicida TaxID=1206997 RepID=A0ABV1KGI1_9PSEU
MVDPTRVPEPGSLLVGTDGVLTGRTSEYVKHLGDMGGVYRDREAYESALAELGPDHVVYRVDEHRVADGPGALTIGTSTLLPGRIGDEYAVTRGHLHAIPDRAELYHCLSGSGLLLLETIDGRSEALELAPGKAVHVPGHWVHRSVNTGDEPLVTLFCYNTDAGQDYSLIEQAGGMASLVVPDADSGWTLRRNTDHTGYAGSTA